MKEKILLHPAVHIITIMILAFAAYSNTFDVPFQYDDILTVRDNLIIRDFQYFAEPSKAEVFKHHFGYHTFRSRYVGYLTFALNYHLHGLDVRGFHIGNLLIHIGTALLIYLLVILCFKTPYLSESKIRMYSGYTAFFTALLFVIHPIQTEAVTYIWQRVASLAGMLYILSVAAYIKWRIHVSGPPGQAQQKFTSSRSLPFYLISITAAVLSMKTKQIAITIPATIAMYEFLFFRGEAGKRVLYLVPFCLTLPIIPFTLIDIGKPFGDMIGDVSRATRDLTELPRLDYFFTQFTVIVKYISLTFLPVNQNVNHEYVIYHSLLDPNVLLSFVFLLVLFGTGIYLMYRSRKYDAYVRLIAAGILWFFITLSVESSLIPIAEIICEYRMYLPSAGLIVVFVTLLFAAAEKMKDRWKHMEAAVVLALLLIVLLLAGTTYARNSVWQNDFTLWQDVVRKNPGGVRGITNLGLAYSKQNDEKSAIELYGRALAIKPDHYEALFNRGNAYTKTGQYDKAIEDYSTALTAFESFRAYFNRGNTYMKTGDYSKAVEDYTKAIATVPRHFSAYHNRGNAYVKSGQLQEAIKDFTTAITLAPEKSAGYSERGFVYFNLARYSLAIQDLTKAVTLEPGNVRAYMRRGYTYAAMGDMENAVQDLKTACSMGSKMSCAALRYR